MRRRAQTPARSPMTRTAYVWSAVVCPAGGSYGPAAAPSHDWRSGTSTTPRRSYPRCWPAWGQSRRPCTSARPSRPNSPPGRSAHRGAHSSTPRPTVCWHGWRCPRITYASTTGGLPSYVADPATAYRDLKSVISVMAPTKDQALELDWSRMADPGNFHQFTGSLQIPGCAAGKGSPPTPPRNDYIAPEAAALQRQLQSEFNECK